MSDKNIFQSVEKTRLSYEVARQIAQAIEEGRFQAGEMLPPARELSVQLNVSRPILQEALTVLQIQGYVSIKHGKGVVVKDPSVDILNVPVDSWLNKNRKQVEDFYAARLVIEPACAELAARHGKAQDIDYLRGLLTTVEPLFHGSNASLLVGPDIDFHSRIAAMADNPYLQKMLASLIIPENDIRKVILRLPKHQPVTHNDHADIFRAIEKHDPRAARAAMITALNRPLTAIRDYLHEKEPAR